MNYAGLLRLKAPQLLRYYSNNPTRWVRCIIPAGKNERIVRCTGLYSAEEEADEISRLSYCPSSKLKEGVFNRCNLPKQEMFYGTLFGEDNDEIQHALITSIFEVSDLCHETSTDDEYYLSGEWLVSRDLSALVIFDHTKPARNTFFQMAKYNADQYLAEHPNNGLGDKGIIDAFSSEVFHNADYRVSAYYADYLFRTQPIDAIVYPSVRTGHVGSCIAIRPSVVDSGVLTLVRASKYRMYSGGEKKVHGRAYEHGHIDYQTGLIRYEPI